MTINHILLQILGCMSILGGLVIGLKTLNWFPAVPEQAVLGVMLLAIGYSVQAGVRGARADHTLAMLVGRMLWFTLGMAICVVAIALLLNTVNWLPTLSQPLTLALLLVFLGIGILGSLRSGR